MPNSRDAPGESPGVGAVQAQHVQRAIATLTVAFADDRACGVVAARPPAA